MRGVAWCGVACSRCFRSLLWRTVHTPPARRALFPARPQDFDPPKGVALQRKLRPCGPGDHTRLAKREQELQSLFRELAVWGAQLPPPRMEGLASAVDALFDAADVRFSKSRDVDAAADFDSDAELHDAWAERDPYAAPRAVTATAKPAFPAITSLVLATIRCVPPNARMRQRGVSERGAPRCGGRRWVAGIWRR